MNGHTETEGAVVMTDMPQSESLCVKKTVTGNMGSRDKEFSFTVTLKNADNTPYIGSIAYAKGEETGTLTADASSSATFTLSHGDPITFTRLSHGLKYTVAEQDYRSDGYTTTIHNNEGTIQAENTTVTFVNNKDAEIATGINVIFETGILMTILGVAMYLFFRMRFKNNR